MPPTPRWDETDLDLVAFELAQTLGDGFERTVDVGLDHHVEGGSLAALDLFEDVFELGATRQGMSLATEARLALPMLTRISHTTGDLLGGGDHELVAGPRNIGKAEHLNRCGRACFLDVFALVVDEGANAAPCRAGNHRIAHLEGSALDQHRGHRTTTDVEVGFEHHAGRPAFRAAAEVFDFGDEQELIEQVVDAHVLKGGDLREDRFAAPRLGNEAVLGPHRRSPFAHRRFRGRIV